MSEAGHAGKASRASSLPLLPIGIAAALVHAAMMIPGYNEDEKFQTSDWLIMTAISIVLAIVLFQFVVPKGGGTSALVLSALGLLATLAFWAMLSLPLAVAGMMTATRARDRGERDGKTTAALIIGLLAVVALVGITVGDAMSSD
ncbi:MAG: hypothetical protein JJD92_10220 [Frankiaceae bacterium]|nr:hypothetical protein [Frankiaceae bacterium]